ncbi:glycosyltransferase [Alicyclobacillaceae bacterium I2511]|nr:glycosyltransferase [Alicyclobacillaceae bacterium I2511]
MAVASGTVQPVVAMSRLSLCMIVRNEANSLPICLASVRDSVDEIILVDTGSRDETVAVAHSFGAKVFSVSWQEDFAQARNFSLAQATGDWILVLDGDEELAAGEGARLRSLMDGTADAYLLSLRNLVGDPAQPGVLQHTQLRLFRNWPLFRYMGAIHEQLPTLSQVRYGIAQVTLIHRGYLDTLVQSQNKVVRNMRILHKQLQAHSEDAALHYYIGNEWLRSRRFPEAIAAYDQAQQAWLTSPERPWLPDLAHRWAYALWQTQQGTAALAVLVQGQQVHPRYTDLWYLQGNIHLAQGDFADAEVAFTRCLELGPPSPEYPTQAGCGGLLASFMRGLVFLQQGRLPEARQDFLNCLSIEPQHAQAQVGLCGCDWLEGKFPLRSTLFLELSPAAQTLLASQDWYYQGMAQMYRAALELAFNCRQGCAGEGGK